ncbi:hypothetical protein MRB53_018317 [Persea americana]|uniref:Uncharacterized protein n=1 Tax=Persea americana TaxID=3435 RepID=A0ACC2M840_PERAE|nr:hypothetical protein MRB53_018317 [Persea americana]
MSSEASSNAIAPPVFDGTNYQVWAVRMEAYLDANDQWEAVENAYEVPPLPDNPTMAQMKNHKEMRQRKSKAKASLFAAVSSSIFTRVMTLKTAKEIWNFLKKEYEGNERVKGMQVLNLIREFEMQRMKESETIKDYSDRLLDIVNKVRLLGTDFSDSRIVQKILVTVPEKFEATISSIENSKDVSSITLAELLNALQAQEQRRLMRQEGSVEGAFQVTSQNNMCKKEKQSNSNNSSNNTTFPPCPHCKKSNHPQKRCWWRPDIKCHKCGQLGHVERVCKSQQQQGEAKTAVEQPQEEQLFVASCFATSSSTESWLIDSGCTSHMTYNQELFKELDKTAISKVKFGNGAYLAVKGKGTVAIEGHTGLKLISNVLYVPEINQNLLSVGQLLEKGYKVFFEDNHCLITDAQGREVFKVQMEGKSFVLNLMEEEQVAVHKEDSTTMLWHQRLGHVHHAALLLMQKNNLGEGLPELEEELSTCAACQYGKQTRLPFPQNKAWRATQKLQLVHTDVKRDKLDKKAEPGIFIGYSSVSKAYRIYLPQTNKVIVSRDVQFFESDRWSWENDKKLEFQEENADINDTLEFQEQNDDIDEEPVRGTRSLSDIYQSMEQIDAFKREMKDVFEMSDLGKMTFFLGMEVKQTQNEIFICQHKYAKEILKKFNMEECKPKATPMNQKEKFCKEDGAAKVDERLYRTLIGCLMYLTATRPDIMNAVSILSRYMHSASEIHFQAAKRIVRYIKGTVDYGLRFCQVKSFTLHGYSDSDWAGCVDDMRSTSGYCFSFGSAIFSWCSKKQEAIAQSTAEAEYVAAAAAVNQALWLRKLMADLYMEQKESTQILAMADLHMEQKERTQILVDNQAAISIANNPVFHGKTKHFKLKLYFLREVQRVGEIHLIYCNTEYQNADILTKPLPKARYEFLRERIGVCSSRAKEENVE